MVVVTLPETLAAGPGRQPVTLGTERSAPVRHLEYLDGLRALAALYVVLYHLLLTVQFRGHPIGALTWAFVEIFRFGHFAVDLFIVLSGFCLMLPVAAGDGTLRGGAWRFFLRRARRIVPTYYCALALSLLLIKFWLGRKTGTHWDISIPVTGKSILTHLLLVQDLSGDAASINHVFWSISIEWRIYLVFPLLVLGWRRYGAVPVFAGAILLSYGLFRVCQTYLNDSLAFHYFGLFAMGMFGAHVAFCVRDPAAAWIRSWPWMLIAAVLSAVFALALYPEMWDGPHLRVYAADYLAGVWSMGLLVAASVGEPRNWLTRALGWRPLVWIGTFAYSIYLMHAPLLQLLWQYPLRPLQAQPLAMLAALVFLGVPSIIGASYIFFLACERPFLTRGRKPAAPPLAVAAALEPAP